ncbi:MAG: class I SAM-dependent methyltransferase [Lachnospiraceae bacterium]|nr:class I SAM-dependent methyltransferase [Lachnospiraceae bacterium]
MRRYLISTILLGGHRNNCICPCCGAWDRERWLYYVLQNKTDISQMSGRILHFAPEKGIINYIKKNERIDYYTADIVSGRAMHVTDITDIQYREGTFDYVISNHVLEHIVDEKKAVNEIKRVLKKNGKWIFSFPICTDITTYEDPAIVSYEARLAAYGQSDHVRLYGYDYKTRFEKYGFELQVFSPEKEIDTICIKKYGFIKDDVIIVATKMSK